MRVGFANRIEAGRELSRLLSKYPKQDSILLTPMNGSVVIGKVISQKTGIPLDVMPVLPFHHPLNWDVHIGAVSPDDLVLSPSYSQDDQYIMEMTPLLRKRLNQQLQLFKKGQLCLPLKGKIVIVVTEGSRTGLKLVPSLQLIARMLPLRVIAAAPVIAPEAARLLAAAVHEVRSLYTPMPFYDIRSFYRDFPIWGDEDLAQIFCATDA